MHEFFGAHDPGPGHPERRDRYTAARRAVVAAGVEQRLAEPAPDSLLERVHPAAYLLGIQALCEQGGGALDPDTVVNGVSFEAARHAAGGAAAAVDAVLGGEVESGFSLGRPPGHHAEPARAMGFCVVNHAAVAAERARELGAERVAIVDWDAHHGNGTQSIFWRDPDVLYASLHQYPHYPGTGSAGERGGGPGEGTTVNVPLAAGTGDAAFLGAFRDLVVPAVRGHQPDLVIVSAGFDAHRADPLCGLHLSSSTFGVMASELAGIGAGRVFVLEGGYDLTALEESVGSVLVATG